MAFDLVFTEEDMAMNEGIGYPNAYAKLCRDRSLSLYRNGPPFTFAPYALTQNEVCRVKEFEELFPIIDPKAKPTAKPKIFVSLLWKQLNHLGNAGFDPATFRVDPYGNVLYFHADSASPLAWEIDHWFPCSRGGLTVPSNLRILQWQVSKKKSNNLEFLIPWWDLQLGISINQFLSIFASSNSDFKQRAFSLLFAEGESEELNNSQAVVSHNFPNHFIESKENIGLAPAAIVLSRRESYESSSTLKSVDLNRRPRPNSPTIAGRNLRIGNSKENEDPNMVTNPYQAIVIARDSLRHREENTKMQVEIQKLDEEMNELKRKAEDEKVAIQELELVLTKRKRRVEKCRRLAEAQSSYRAMLEKMIRDAMHQSVVYKQQVRLNQAAANALKARLEAQKAICDSSEKDLYRKFKQRDELESQIKPERDHYMRKRSRVDELALEERKDKTTLSLPSNQTSVHFERGSNSRVHLHKELRVYLEEEQRAYEERLSQIEENSKEGEKIESLIKVDEYDKIYDVRLPTFDEEEREDEESRRNRGKGNVEKWLQMLLEDAPENIDDYEEMNSKSLETGDLKLEKKNEGKIVMRKSPYTIEEKGKMKELDENEDNIIEDLDNKYPKNEIEHGNFLKKEASLKIQMKSPPYTIDDKSRGIGSRNSFESGKIKEKNELGRNESKGIGRRNSFENGKKKEKNESEKGFARSESFRAFRRIPSSPSLILGMKKGVDYCIRRKPSVIEDEDDGDADDKATKSSGFFKSFKKTVKI